MTLSTPTVSEQRSCGLLEKYQLSKTLTGSYGSVTCTAHLQHQLLRDSNDMAKSLLFYLNQFYPAVTSLVRQYPSLGLNVREPAMPSAHFVHTSCFPLDELVSVQEETGSLDEAISAACDEELVVLDHDSNLPLWRLQVLVQPDVFDRCTVIFIAHHVVIDGACLSLFWQAFLEALNSPESEKTMQEHGNWMVTTTDGGVDGLLTLEPPMEARSALPKPSYLDYGKLAGGILKDLLLPAKWQHLMGLSSPVLETLWQGDTAAIEGERHKTSIQLRKIGNNESWRNLLRLAKETYHVSVHAALHAALLMAWSEIYSDQATKVTTPVNCRPLAKVPRGEFGNFVGAYEHVWLPEMLLHPPSSDTTTTTCPLLWRLAVHYHAALQSNKSRVAVGGQFLGLLDYPKGYVGYWHDKRKKNRMGREGGLEHSDLGRFHSADGENATWLLDGLWFAQSAQIYTTALGLNTITVKDVVYASFGCQRGSLDESKVTKVMDRFVDILQTCIL